PHLLVHGTDLSPRHPLLPPAMTSNLLPMLPVYFVTDLAGPYRAPPSPGTRRRPFPSGSLFLSFGVPKIEGS
ncbi:MAG: hypothetical protein ACLQAT_04670, partial [Candidatus Binataceae bacterium]